MVFYVMDNNRMTRGKKRRDGEWGRVGVKMAVLVLDTGGVIPADVPVEFINCVQ